ncbi:MAG TPA: hypothetical protein PL077_02990, partial [Treponemataceae bacterium]|nr:hypothetical protein [Treponemataceae bacterium]
QARKIGTMTREQITRARKLNSQARKIGTMTREQITRARKLNTRASRQVRRARCAGAADGRGGSR